MFQFPGFALLTLCIQVRSTCFTALLKPAEAGNNNEVSGGLPHSEIHGSKLILSSSWLIAEYHVFHRLLLPRHSPNALFALDLIQKKQGQVGLTVAAINSARYFSAHSRATGTKVILFSRSPSWFSGGSWLVYLTWTTLFVSGGIYEGERGSTHHHTFPEGNHAEILGHTWPDQTVLILYLSLRCQFVQLDG